MSEHAEISARKALKSTKCHRLNTAKYYENTNSQYTTEYTKQIKDTYFGEYKKKNGDFNKKYLKLVV